MIRIRVAFVAIVAALALIAVACGDDGGSDAGSGVTIDGVWSRATAPDAANGAVYMELTSEDGDALVNASVSSDIAETVELHETVASGGSMEGDDDMTMEDGESMDSMEGDDSMTKEGDDHSGHSHGDEMGSMKGMQQVTQIDLPAGETVALEPGGFHVMLIGLAGQLEVGESFDVTLTFENAGERTVTAEVREA